ncbi:hypothetical protein [Iodobacter ciconiae]|uniref:Lipoprotein n=1 Tax=Iodobacter ciconiae TaxID=2496266 RepID=A0A3S8ZRK7_9NEIS|nr:hypothetical protein [Iodobacter ciconiae]AZN36122.1 hypothetical protein EJO50_06295 [Iodobacter ciconiae]
MTKFYLVCVLLVFTFTGTGCVDLKPVNENVIYGKSTMFSALGRPKTKYTINQFIYHSIRDGADKEKTADYFTGFFGKPANIYNIKSQPKLVYGYDMKSKAMIVYDWHKDSCQIMIAFDPVTKLIIEFSGGKEHRYKIDPTISYISNCSTEITGPERKVLSDPDIYRGNLSIRLAAWGIFGLVGLGTVQII